MKRLIIISGMCLLISSCGYDSYEECSVKEMQKCGADNNACNYQAGAYCRKEFPSEEAKREAALEEKYPLINDPKCKWDDEQRRNMITFSLPDNKELTVPCDLTREESKELALALCAQYPGLLSACLD